MARIKLTLPEQFPFSTTIPIRITDLNYGAHVGNDTILTLMHEARMQFLKSLGYEELNIAGVGLIMSDAVIEFKREVFYGTFLNVHMAAGDFTRVGFDLYYKLTIGMNKMETVVAAAKTGMVCFDYTKRKVVAVPDDAVKKLQSA
jgi:acyl-CoA thioester hydrolase